MKTPISHKDISHLLHTLAGPAASVEVLPLEKALGLRIAEEIRTPEDVPSFTQSAMDGYAFCGRILSEAAGEVRLRVSGSVLAGHPLEGEIAFGEAARIMTGGLIPAGCDTVIPFEKVRLEGEAVFFRADAVKPEANVRRQGEILHAGEAVLSPGDLLTPEALGLAASMGRGELACRVVRCAVFATGDELRQPGEALPGGCVWNANGPMLAAHLRSWGGRVEDLGILPDDENRMTGALGEAIRTNDLIVTAGGVGEGDKDLVGRVLSHFGEVRLFNMKIRPGKPLALGRLSCGGRTVLFVGLPGNPAAAALSARIVLKEVFQILSGANDPEPLLIEARTRLPLRGKTGRTDFLRGNLAGSEEGLLFEPMPSQSSATLFFAAHARAAAVLDESAARVESGETVRVMALP